VVVLAIAVPRGRMLFIMSDNPVGEIRHSDEVGRSSRVCNGSSDCRDV
jgi:hypothetical protein